MLGHGTWEERKKTFRREFQVMWRLLRVPHLSTPFEVVCVLASIFTTLSTTHRVCKPLAVVSSYGYQA
jgi:hypothetical protein